MDAALHNHIDVQVTGRASRALGISEASHGTRQQGQVLRWNKLHMIWSEMEDNGGLSEEEKSFHPLD